MKKLFVVLDDTGEPQHCASWPEACHEHINDLIDRGLNAAGKWVVREVVCIDDLGLKETIRVLKFALDKGDKPMWLSDGWREDARLALSELGYQ